MCSLQNSETHRFACTFEGCNARFSKNSKLVYHTGKHTGERPFVCQEENCSKSYTNPAHLRRHKKVCHENQKPENIMCPYEGCLTMLASEFSFKKHCNRKHNPEREFPFACKDCKKGFVKKRQLSKHSYEHTGIPPFKCDICEARFLTFSACNRHKRTHASYTCICKETFERWSSLLAHKRQCEIAKPKYECRICKKAFSTANNLKLHGETHKDKDDKVVFPCTYENCSRFYFQERNLNYHINMKHKKREEPNIPCTFPDCKQEFKKKQYLKNHLKTIHGEKKKPKPRKPRKDKNIPKKNFVAKLVGLDLPNSINESEAPIILNKLVLGEITDSDDYNSATENQSEHESEVENNCYDIVSENCKPVNVMEVSS